MIKLISIFLALFVLSVSGIAHSKDILKGSTEISGDLDLSLSSSKMKAEGESDVETDSQTVSASVLYYFDDNFGFGLLWSYDSAESTSGNFESEASYNIIGPAVSYNVS